MCLIKKEKNLKAFYVSNISVQNLVYISILCKIGILILFWKMLIQDPRESVKILRYKHVVVRVTQGLI